MLVDSFTYQQRLNICRACPHHMIWFGALRCSICKCFMAAKAKISRMECPKGYWRRTQ